jgi:hypothetical protein
MWDHSAYNMEANARRTERQKRTVCISEIEPLSVREKLLVENAYRRGFFQGWYQCLETMKDAASECTLERFLYGPLYRWRYSKHGGKLTIPPELRRIKLSITTAIQPPA